MTELPPGWVQVPLGKVATSQLGRMLSSGRETGEHPKPYLRNRDVQWGHINIDDLPVMDFGPRDAIRFALQPGDVLICEGGEVGRAAIWNGQLAECYYQKALHRVRTSAALMPEYLRYLLEHYARTKAFERYTSGSTIAHLPQEDLRNLPIPVPPAAEQKRIVAAIEEQLSRLDAGVMALNRAERKLRRMRAAVFEAAVRGELLHGVCYMRQVAVEDVAEVSGGITKNPKRMPRGNGVPFLRVANVMRDRLDLRDVHKIEVFDGELERLRLQRGDLLVVEGNGSPDQIGRSALWDGSIDPCVHQNHLIRVRPGMSILPEYLNIFWNSPSGMGKVQGIASSTSGLHTLSTGKVRRIQINLPPLTVQERIVAEVEQRVTILDALEYQVSIAKRRVSVLRSAILTHAFSGQLVQQDPVEEPASVFLGRITHLREAATA